LNKIERCASNDGNEEQIKRKRLLRGDALKFANIGEGKISKNSKTPGATPMAMRAAISLRLSCAPDGVTSSPNSAKISALRTAEKSSTRKI
jgi:hypothetical protein